MWIVRIALDRPYTFRDSLHLFTNRYKGGVDTYLQVITAQKTELANERNAIDILPPRNGLRIHTRCVNFNQDVK
jgi:hypothetical protein